MRPHFPGVSARERDRPTLDTRMVAADGALDDVAGIGTAQSLTRLLSVVPASVSGYFGFEVRDASPGADLLLQLRPHEAFEAGASRLLSGGDVTVERVLRTLLAGAVAADDHDDACDDVWVEYDVDRSTADLPVPSLFCSPRLDGPMARGRLPRLLCGGDEATVAAALELERRAWPDAFAFQRGGMLPRSPAPLRLCMKARGPLRWLRNCERLAAEPSEWRRLVDQATEVVARVGAGRIAVDLDVLDGHLLPSIGIEIPALERRALSEVSSRLSMAALATADWLERVEAWHADVVAATPSTAAQLAVLSPIVLPGHVVQHGVRRRVSHFKVTLQAGSEPAVKAYLGLELGRRLLTSEERK